MFSKNHKAKTKAEQEHIAWVKEQPCGVCGEPGPSDAHHIQQQLHLLTIPLCKDCHQGSFNGLHGQARMWKTLKKDEMTVLNETIRRMYDNT